MFLISFHNILLSVSEKEGLNNKYYIDFVKRMVIFDRHIVKVLLVGL